MIEIFRRLRTRNPALYWYGWICAGCALICAALIQTSALEVSGLPAALKPLKFFLSVWIAVWTLGWIVSHLREHRAVRRYTIATLVAMSIELLIIGGQAARGRMSHFNTASIPDATLFYIMGAAITGFTIWTLVIALKFFKPLNCRLPATLLWGIRLGLLAFVAFGFEGGVMGYFQRHSVGGADDPEGWPILHWSAHFGDLRISHFFGLHSLQVLPLLGFIFSRKPAAFWSLSALYLGTVTMLLVRALMGLPL
jgi:hypothetical protein